MPTDGYLVVASHEEESCALCDDPIKPYTMYALLSEDASAVHVFCWLHDAARKLQANST